MMNKTNQYGPVSMMLHDMDRSSEIVLCFSTQVCLWSLNTQQHWRLFLRPQEELEVCPVEN